MAVVIRLRRTGRTNLPCFRITATDSRFPRDGRSLETLGLYDPLRKEAAQQVQLERERIEYWLGQGAKASNAVASILRRNGIVVVRPVKKPRERARGKKTAVRARRDASAAKRAEAKVARAALRKQQKRAAAKAAGAEAKKAE